MCVSARLQVRFFERVKLERRLHKLQAKQEAGQGTDAAIREMAQIEQDLLVSEKEGKHSHAGAQKLLGDEGATCKVQGVEIRRCICFQCYPIHVST